MGRRRCACWRKDNRVDLLFTDVVLPGGLTGAQVAAQARALRPDLKVLFTTGYARERHLPSRPAGQRRAAHHQAVQLCRSGGEGARRAGRVVALVRRAIDQDSPLPRSAMARPAARLLLFVRTRRVLRGRPHRVGPHARRAGPWALPVLPVVSRTV